MYQHRSTVPFLGPAVVGATHVRMFSAATRNSTFMHAPCVDSDETFSVIHASKSSKLLRAISSWTPKLVIENEFHVFIMSMQVMH